MQFVFAAESALDESLPGKETARLINMYPEKGGSRSPVTHRGVPGLKETTSLGSGKVQAMISASDGLYAAVGGKLVRWDGAVTELGSIPDGVTTMARNTTQIGITAGGKYYVWDGSTLESVAGAAFTNIGSVAYVDAFMILTQLDGEAYAYSDPANAKSLDALDFASAEASPDKIVRAVAVGGILWLLGEDSIEAWNNAGSNVDSPFRRIQSQRLEKGLRSIAEVTLLDNTFFWVSNEGRAYRQQEGVPVRVSTDAVEAAIEGSEDVSVMAYQIRGHDFFVIRLKDKPSWVFDAATGAWHERSTGPTHRPWEVTATVHHNGVWYAGTKDGQLCTFGGYQDRGEELRREARSALLSDGGERFTISKVDVRTEGSGNLMMRLSRDGRIYGGERVRAFGAKYGDRTTFRALGQCREVSMMLACTDNTDFAIHGTTVNG